VIYNAPIERNREIKHRIELRDCLIDHKEIGGTALLEQKQ